MSATTATVLNGRRKRTVRPPPDVEDDDLFNNATNTPVSPPASAHEPTNGNGGGGVGKSLLDIQRQQHSSKRRKLDTESTPAAATASGEPKTAPAINYYSQLSMALEQFGSSSGSDGSSSSSAGGGGMSVKPSMVLVDNYAQTNPNSLVVKGFLAMNGKSKKNQSTGYNLSTVLRLRRDFMGKAVSENVMKKVMHNGVQCGQVFVVLHRKGAPKGQTYVTLKDQSVILHPGFSPFISAYSLTQPGVKSLTPFTPVVATNLRPTCEKIGGPVYWNVDRVIPENVQTEHTFLTVINNVSRSEFWLVNLTKDPPKNPYTGEEVEGLDEASKALLNKQMKEQKRQVQKEFETTLSEPERDLLNDTPITFSWNSTHPNNIDRITPQHGTIQRNNNFKPVSVTVNTDDSVQGDMKIKMEMTYSCLLWQWNQARGVPFKEMICCYNRRTWNKAALRSIFGYHNIHKHPEIINVHAPLIEVVEMPFIDKAKTAVLAQPGEADTRMQCEVGVDQCVNEAMSNLDVHLTRYGWPVTYGHVSQIFINHFENRSTECEMNNEVKIEDILTEGEIKDMEKMNLTLNNNFRGLVCPLETTESVRLEERNAGNERCYLLTNVPFSDAHRVALTKAGWAEAVWPQRIVVALTDPNSKENKVLAPHGLPHEAHRIPFVLKSIAIKRVDNYLKSFEKIKTDVVTFNSTPAQLQLVSELANEMRSSLQRSKVINAKLLREAERNGEEEEQYDGDDNGQNYPSPPQSDDDDDQQQQQQRQPIYSDDDENEADQDYQIDADAGGQPGGDEEDDNGEEKVIEGGEGDWDDTTGYSEYDQ